MHVAFTAPSRQAVERFGTASERLGAKTLRAAGPHPDIAPDYYGAVINDLDGHKIEILAQDDFRSDRPEI